MTSTRFFASALFAAASLVAVSSANAVVPGSDTFERARDSAATQSVIENGAPQGRGGVVEGRTTYGYSGTVGTRNPARGLVPGSSTFSDAADSAALMDVITAPRGTFTAAPNTIRRIVPGSDSF